MGNPLIASMRLWRAGRSTRRAILPAGEATVRELAEPFSPSQPDISKHLKILDRVGLISRGRDALRRLRRLTAQPMRQAIEWLESYRQFSKDSFHRLALSGEMKADDKKCGATRN